MDQGRQGKAETDRTPRCVVLTTAGGELPARLQPVLKERGWQPVVVDDPFLAMSDLGVLERGQASRAAWGVQPVDPPGLVIVAPPADHPCDDLKRLIGAVRRYLPSVSIWLFHHATLAPLADQPPTPATGPDNDRATEEDLISIGRRRGGVPDLQYRPGPDAGHADPLSPGPPDDEPGDALPVTLQEMEMLFQDDPDRRPPP